MTSLADRVIIITGASSGIGRSTARVLAGNGARIALVSRSESQLRSVQQEIGNRSFSLPVDVADPDAGERIVAATLERFGRVDAVFANAGIYLNGQVVETGIESIRHTIDVNVFGTLGVVRATLPHLMERGSGDIIITSSIAGHQALPSEPVYSASKHAVQAFTHALRRQIASSGVRVSEIAPGVVLTDLWGYSEDDPRAAERVEAATGILPEDVADAVRYMLTRPQNVTIRDLVILPSAQVI